MLKRNISGQEMFDVSNITNKKLNTVNYEKVNSKIGYPFNITYADGLNHSYRQKHIDVTKDYSIFGMYESKKISNIIIPKVSIKKNVSYNPMFFELFPNVPKDIIIDLHKTEIDDILITPKKVSLNVPDTTSIQYDVDGMTEEQRIIKKMTQDNIDESGDINYYTNFLQDHLNRKYNVPVVPVVPPIVPVVPVVPIRHTTPPRKGPIKITRTISPISPSTPPPLPLPLKPTTPPQKGPIKTSSIRPSPHKLISTISTLPLPPPILSSSIASSSAPIVTTNVFSTSVQKDDVSEKSIGGNDYDPMEDLLLSYSKKIKQKTLDTASIAINKNNIIISLASDMQKIYPETYEKLSTILNDTSNDNNISNEARTNINYLLSTFNKRPIPISISNVRTVFKTFVKTFMKVESKSIQKLNDPDLFSITPTKSN